MSRQRQKKMYYFIYSEKARRAEGRRRFVIINGKKFEYMCMSSNKDWKSNYVWPDAKVVAQGRNYKLEL
jgi:hypothetical protein